MPGLLCTISAGMNEDSVPLEVYGPVGLRQLLRTVLNLARSQLQFRYKVHELHHDIHPGDYDGMVCFPLCYVSLRSICNVMSAMGYCYECATAS